MLEIDFNFITGVSLGIEFPPVSQISDDLSFALVIDLLILRIQFAWWKTEA